MTVLSFVLLFLSFVAEGLAGAFALFGAGLFLGHALSDLLNEP